MTCKDVLVLGAGPSGLAFSFRYGPGAVILEKASESGGLSRSVEIQDGVFDIGGHSFHTPHPEVRELVLSLLDGAWFEQPRDARVWIDNQIIPYPFQHHFEKLKNQKIVQDCLGHEFREEETAKSGDFKEWILRRFGHGVAKHFMLPYNEKLWSIDLSEMACDWVKERVATSKKANSDANKMPTRTPLQADTSVGYPSVGGFGEIFKAFEKQCHEVHFNQDIVHIDLEKRTVRTRQGQEWNWNKIVSTMPLPYLLRCLSECPSHIIERASGLRAVSLKVIMILADLKGRTVPQRIYIADKEVPPHKIAFNHNSSPGLGKRKHHAITCEVAYSSEKSIGSDTEIIGSTIRWLVDNEYIESRNDIKTSKVIDVPLGYPIYTHSKPALVEEIRQYLKAHGIYTIGRFGAWEYVNSDECIYQGINLADSFMT